MKYNKYSNKKTVIDGIKFDSKKESQRYLALKEMERSGEIRDLKLQPKFVLQEKFRSEDHGACREIAYIADFSYFTEGCDKMYVEDVKGVKTDVFKLKMKMFLHRYGETHKLVIT